MKHRNAVATDPASLKRRWWQSPFSVFQTNLQEIDVEADIGRVLDFIEAYGADCWLLNAGGLVSFYPSELRMQAPTRFLAGRASGDFLRDATEAARQRGIQVLARLDLSKIPPALAEEHPDWLYVSPVGTSQVYGTVFSTCPTSEYYQVHSLAIIDEIIGKYKVDGFFLNHFKYPEVDYNRDYHGPCHCERCRALFSNFSAGKEMPAEPNDQNYQLWLEFSSDFMKRTAKRLSAHLCQHHPDVALTLRYGTPVICYEANNALGRDFWPHATAQKVSSHTARHHDIPIMVVCTSFVDMPYRMAAEQPELFAHFQIQAMARGGHPSTYIMGVPARTSYPNLEVGATITRFFRDHKAMYGQLRTASTIALVQPPELRTNSSSHNGALQEFRGLYLCLKERHIPFDVVRISDLAAMIQNGDLLRYMTTILPDVGSLGSKLAESLDGYVAQGGNLVLTGSSGISKFGEIELSSCPSCQTVGDARTGSQLWSNYVYPAREPPCAPYHYEVPVIPISGSYRSFVWKAQAELLDRTMPAAPFAPPEQCYGHVVGHEPGAVAIRSGDGAVIRFPWSVGQTYWEFDTSNVRDYFVDKIGVTSKLVIAVDLPEQVEVVVGKTDRDLVLHLLNQTGVRRRSVGRHVPISNGRIRVRGGIDAHALVSATSPACVREGSDLVIELPPLDLFEVVTVKLDRGT